MQKLPPILADIASALAAIIFALGAYKGLSTLIPKLIQLWQDRNKPKAEQALILAQRDKVLAEAGEVRTRSDVSLIQIALGMAASRRVEVDELRAKVSELKAELERERRRSGNGRG